MNPELQMSEQMIELLIPWPNHLCDFIIPVCWLLCLRLHLLHNLMAWGKPINDVHSEHLQDDLFFKRLEVTGKDASFFPASTIIAFVFVYSVRFKIANADTPSPLTFAFAGSSLFIFSISGMNATNQSIGQMFSLSPWRFRKFMFGLPNTCGLIPAIG